MITTTGTAVAYKEDIMRLLNCSEYTAVNLMKQTGEVFKIGKRYAIPNAALKKIIHAPIEIPERQMLKGIEVPEDYYSYDLNIFG